ncbi:heme exporter protein CcmD [Xanthobacter sp. V2C-8]|uniref:heme exporter protein CcmD n=1 Tax=Xanthobacter albus TaxID=3119929 RepID=UPI0037269255
MSHTFFIAAAYGVSLLGLGLLAAWMLLSYRHERRTLAELEARGLRRRSRVSTATAAGGEPLVGTK